MGERWCHSLSQERLRGTSLGDGIMHPNCRCRCCDGGLVHGFSWKQEHLDHGFLNHLWGRALYFYKTHTACDFSCWLDNIWTSLVLSSVGPVHWSCIWVSWAMSATEVSSTQVYCLLYCKPETRSLQFGTILRASL